MGYSHYWSRQEVIDSAVFSRILQDFRLLLAPLRRMGVPLAGPFGTGEPTLEKEDIRFNGVMNCGHEPIAAMGWPADSARGVRMERSDVVVGSWGDGPSLSARTCNGDCSNETFAFPRVLELKPWHVPHNGLYPQACKTAFKPYDLAITALLVIAKHHLGTNIRTGTDGELQHFRDGMNLCQKHLGYGKDFRFG